MYQLESILNTIIQGNSLDILRQIPDTCINMAITSPPYYGKRDYSESTEAIWGGLPCEHEWGGDIKPAGYRSNDDRYSDTLTSDAAQRRDMWCPSKICTKCGAWKGQLGLEPTPSLYIQHLAEIFAEVMRVLKPYGSLYVNLGDSYNNNPSNSAESNLGNASALGLVGRQNRLQADIPTKSLLCIPDKFKIAMVEHGWICRNDLIWYKPNCMPSSADDRFTEDYERIFFFVKSNSDLFWTNEKTLQLITKPPKGTSGTEGTDWCWIPCPNCNKPKEAIQASLEENEPPQQENGACKRCGGIGKIKQSYWQSHDYYFEQQFEPHQTENLEYERTKKSKWGIKKAQTCKPNVEDYRDETHAYNSLGRNKRTVWGIPEECFVVDVHGEATEITTSELEHILQNRTSRAKASVWDIVTKPMKEAHYASYPKELIETPIRASCPEFVCNKCGMPRVKIYKEQAQDNHSASKYQSKYLDNNYGQSLQGFVRSNSIATERESSHEKAKELFPNNYKAQKEYVKFVHDHGGMKTAEFLDYTNCGCGADYTPGIVLDMFMGSGTTAITAKELGRRYIGCELNPDYIKIAQRRIERIKGTQKRMDFFEGIKEAK